MISKRAIDVAYVKADEAQRRRDYNSSNSHAYLLYPEITLISKNPAAKTTMPETMLMSLTTLATASAKILFLSLGIIHSPYSSNSLHLGIVANQRITQG